MKTKNQELKEVLQELSNRNKAIEVKPLYESILAELNISKVTE